MEDGLALRALGDALVERKDNLLVGFNGTKLAKETLGCAEDATRDVAAKYWTMKKIKNN